MKILVVDSDASTAEQLARMLTREHEVLIASDSEVVMLHVCRSRPRAVLFKRNAALLLAEQILTAMSRLGDLTLVVHDGTISKEDIDCLAVASDRRPC